MRVLTLDEMEYVSGGDGDFDGDGGGDFGGDGGGDGDGGVAAAAPPDPTNETPEVVVTARPPALVSEGDNVYVQFYSDGIDVLWIQTPSGFVKQGNFVITSDVTTGGTNTVQGKLDGLKPITTFTATSATSKITFTRTAQQ